MEKSLAFVHYILGLIDASPDGLDEAKTKLVKEKLQDMFIHEIDPSLGFSKEEFDEANRVHSGEVVDKTSLPVENSSIFESIEDIKVMC
jgi:hypothetical protein